MLIGDVQPWEFDPRHCLRAYDAIAREGVIQRRHGMAVETGQQATTQQIVSAGRAKFVRSATGTPRRSTFVLIHSGGQVTLRRFVPPWQDVATVALDVDYIPRAVYNDEVIFCAQDGRTPLLRWGGRSAAMASEATGLTWTVGEPKLSHSSVVGDSEPGGFAVIRPGAVNSISSPALSLRAIKAFAGGAISMEGVRPSAANGVALLQYPLGGMYPCVLLQRKGTYSSNGAGAITGYGTAWQTSYDSPTLPDLSSTKYLNDAIIGIPEGVPGGTAAIAQITGVSSDTALSAQLPDTTGSKYSHVIARRGNFTDVTVYKGSLLGIGTAQFPNRVWIGPPGWDIGLPPGSSDTTSPFDPAVPVAIPVGEAEGYFLMDYIDVPALTDDDRNVAIYGTPQGAVLLKVSSVWIIRGSYPNFTTELIADGAGCLNLLASCTTSDGVYWAGPQGVWFLPNGGVRPIDLTQGRIGTYYRRQILSISGGTRTVILGHVAGHLFVLIRETTVDGDRHFVCDVRDPRNPKWQSFFRGLGTPRFLANITVPGEHDALFYSSDSYQGYLIDLAPTVTGYRVTDRDAQTTAVANDDDALATTNAPRFEVQSGDIATPGDQDLQSRLIESAVSYRYSGGPGITATFEATNDAGQTVSLSAQTLTTDATGNLNRVRLRSGLEGRQHNLKIAEPSEVTTNGPSQCRIEEIAVTVRERRPRR
jgi:hypothetical protein